MKQSEKGGPLGDRGHPSQTSVLTGKRRLREAALRCSLHQPFHRLTIPLITANAPPLPEAGSCGHLAYKPEVLYRIPEQIRAADTV